MTKTIRLLCPGLLGPLVTTTALAQQPGSFTIEGQDARLAGRPLYLLPPERPAAGQPWPALDSARADAAGHVALRGRVPIPDVYWLRVDRHGPPQRVPLAGQGEQLTFHVAEAAASTRWKPRYYLLPGGSPEAELLLALVPYAGLRGQAVPTGDAALRRLQHLLRLWAGSYLAPYLTYTYLRPQPQARPLLDSLTDRFAREQPTSPYLPALQARRAAPPAPAVGEPAPDFTLPDALSQPLTLSSLRGRYVLVEFWASWCGPCRAAHPALRQTYQRYQNRGAGFTVLGVSLDEDAAAWQWALRQEALPWPQVRDPQGLRGGEGAVARAYQLVGVPAGYLLDPAGRLVATPATGVALDRLLARYLR